MKRPKEAMTKEFAVLLDLELLLREWRDLYDDQRREDQIMSEVMDILDMLDEIRK